MRTTVLLTCMLAAIMTFAAIVLVLTSAGCASEPEVSERPSMRQNDAAVPDSGNADDDAGIKFETPDGGKALACGSPFDVVFKSKTCGELKLSKFSGCKTISAPSGCITTAEYECENPCHSSIWMEWNGERGQVIEARACGENETSVCVYLK